MGEHQQTKKVSYVYTKRHGDSQIGGGEALPVIELEIKSEEVMQEFGETIDQCEDRLTRRFEHDLCFSLLPRDKTQKVHPKNAAIKASQLKRAATTGATKFR